MKTYYDYYYNLSIAYFISDCGCAFMDNNKYDCLNPTKGEAGDVLVSLDDLLRIYAPYLECSADGDKLHIEYRDAAADITVGSCEVQAGGAAKTMPAPVQKIDGIIYLPAGAFMNAAFDMFVASTADMELDARTWGRGEYVIAVCDKYEYKEIPGLYRVEAVPRENFELQKSAIQWIKRNLDGKKDGELLRSFWFEKAGKVQTYSLYVPTGYDPAVPSRMVVALHGGGLGEQAIYSLSQNKVQFWADRFNYIFLAPNACTKNSTYDNLLDPGAGTYGRQPDYDCPENPYHFSDEEIAKVKLGEYAVLDTIDDVCKYYNIDRGHIFLQGNSMGGLGTFHMGANYPELFRAIAPFGIGLDLKTALLYPNLKDKPMRIVSGTEDPGYPKTRATYEFFRDHGYNVTVDYVGGGVHYDSWAYVLEDTFKFFEKNS